MKKTQNSYKKSGVNISLANKLGWSPSTSIKDGIKKTVEIYTKQLKENTIRY